jgi:hypothetical protein
MDTTVYNRFVSWRRSLLALAERTTPITYNEAVFGRSRDNTTKIRDRSDIVSSLGMGQSSSFGTGLEPLTVGVVALVGSP